ncbi:hypothetical protein CAI16_04695 [Virgibacillus dokdonensis]|uniref:DUF1510 domain-containing protein n=1 Tax=Virgibacillus dokdonensis TaxID=302167 RepID=A0A3E0WU10_9BACI|nr:YrrS family protein [Virgibacillus dokdonensis]RFA36328.1 hypothetical protein CAI16_04695 [Virgibacillus dokdonensis]
MGDFDRVSRVDKFEKRRKNTKSISIFLIIGAVLVLILLGVWMFGGGDESSEENKDTSNEQAEAEDNGTEDSKEGDNNDQFTRVEDDEDNTQSSDNEKDEQDNIKEEEQAEDNSSVETEQVESSDDNVVKAFTGDWKPIGTEQKGTHTTNYNEGSQDRKEIETAVTQVTGLDKNSMVTHWVGNGGSPEKVEATVSTEDNTQIYRVYLIWIEEQGWKPTKVEQLKSVIINR